MRIRAWSSAWVLADLRLRGNDDGIAAILGVHTVQPDVPALPTSGDTAPGRLRDAHDAWLELLNTPVPADERLAAITDLLSGQAL